MRSKLSPIFLLLLVHVLKGIITIIIVPLWEFPDEQAHFGQTAYMVETGFPVNPNFNLNQEIYYSEQVMGTVRDSRGNNYFTYHPERKHLFSNTTLGPQELFLNQLPTSSRKTYVVNESTRDFPIYYFMAGLGYRLAYHGNLIDRVFLARIVTIIISTVSIYICYQVGLTLFSDSFFALVLASLVSFHPMFSFVGSGINNDNLMNLWGTTILLMYLKIIKFGLTAKRIVTTGLVIGFGILTKPLIFPLLPSLFLVLLIEWFQSKRPILKQLGLLIPLIVVSIIAGGWKFVLPIINAGDIMYLPRIKSEHLVITPIDYIISNIQFHYRQTLVWYWGVFKWLGVVLPLNLIRFLKILMVVSGLGMIKYFITTKPNKYKTMVTFLLIHSLLYILFLSWWDYLTINSMGFSQGLQGRYFFPTIVAHMSLFLIGLSYINTNYQIQVSISALLIMISAHFISWIVLITTYYSTNDWHQFFIQLSQYKPSVVKYPCSIIWFSSYFGIVGYFLYNLIKNNYHNSSDKFILDLKPVSKLKKLVVKRRKK